ncbi:MAG TPA: 5,6-dimethylbenzimidazole synthase [Acidimicrobiales bacterium]|nr:5,6-dimethylbenzimidazole synthase [Acidimicrobiales bacterium]
MAQTWSRPVPTIGDPSSAQQRAVDPTGWSFAASDQEALSGIMSSRRDIRRFRPDPVDEDILNRLLSAAHQAPSVGHSQPWRFVVVTDPQVRARAAVLADRARLAQAAEMDRDSGQHLLDLDLEGIREAPVGIVVCCDRRTPPTGVLGRATFRDADVWSCACAIQNLWLTARAAGLGVGWVTLFRPSELADLVGIPAGVESLGWLCIGWPDERPPSPGLERRGWSERAPLEAVVMREHWEAGRPPPVSGSRMSSRVAMPSQEAVVAAHDTGDSILSAPGSLGVLDRVVDKVLALAAGPGIAANDEVVGFASGSTDRWGTLVLAAADHPVRRRGVSAYDHPVTRSVAEATVAGRSLGAVAATSSGLAVVVVDAGVEGGPVSGALQHRPAFGQGDISVEDALSVRDVETLLVGGSQLGRAVVTRPAGSAVGVPRMVALGEVGIGNTTVAAALAAGLLGLEPGSAVGMGAGADSAMVERKRSVVAAALGRVNGETDPQRLLAAVGGPDIAFLAGVVQGAAEAGGLIVLDGLATSVAALVVVRDQPAIAAHLVAGQRSREPAHRAVLDELGLEPLLDLRLRAGEGAGACLAAGILKAALRIRLATARTA